MPNWRLLLLGFIAVLHPIASFTERNLVDGRQECCDRKPHSLFRENRFSDDESHRKVSSDRRLDQRHAIRDERRSDTEGKSLIERAYEHNIRSKNIDARLSRIKTRISSVSIERRDLDRSDSRKTAPRTTLLRHNEIDPSYSATPDQRFAQTNNERTRRISSQTRLTSVRQQNELHRIATSRQKTEILEDNRKKADKYILRNIDIIYTRRDVKQIRSRLNNIRQDRRFNRGSTGGNHQIIATVSSVDWAPNRYFRIKEQNPRAIITQRQVVMDNRIEYNRERIRHNNLFTNNKNFMTDRLLIPAGDSDNFRSTVTHSSLVTEYSNLQNIDIMDISLSKIDGNSAAIRSDKRKNRKIGANSIGVRTENQREMSKHELSQRQTNWNNNRYQNILKRAQRKNVRENIPNLDINQRYGVNDEQNRKTNLRDERRGFGTVINKNPNSNTNRKYALDKYLQTMVETRESTDIRRINYDTVRRESINRKSTPKEMTDELKRQINFDLKSQVYTRGLKVQTDQINGAERGHIYRKTSVNRVRQIQRDGRGYSVHKTETERTGGTRSKQRTTRGEDRNVRKLSERESVDKRQIELERSDKITRHSARRGLYREERNRQMHVRGEETSLDILQKRLDSTRRYGVNRDMIQKEEMSKKITTKENKLNKLVGMRHVEVRENRKLAASREFNPNVRSLERLISHDHMPVTRLLRSAKVSEPTDSRPQAMKAQNENRENTILRSHYQNSVLTTRRNINELNNMEPDNNWSGNWQILFYILQGVYICGIFMDAIKGDGSTKITTKKQNWWFPASQRHSKIH